MSSNSVAIGTITTLSVIVAAGCTPGDPVTADCVITSPGADGSYQVVDDRFCDGGSHSSYTYVYGGSSSGGRIRGATTVRPSDVHITTRKGTVVQRGGFGGRGAGGS
ncbi:hypothetical protein AB0K21_21835 [Streptosporangium sp. NPDC049248]|uniref:hypothetical protein n=1 Tax=Streptosporangium sp. NPDC049248 TaxID=3155651 RepID=UPI0034270A4A